MKVVETLECVKLCLVSGGSDGGGESMGKGARGGLFEICDRLWDAVINSGYFCGGGVEAYGEEKKKGDEFRHAGTMQQGRAFPRKMTLACIRGIVLASLHEVRSDRLW